jgi:hypothetical protein
MATTASAYRQYTSDHGFFLKMAAAIAVTIVLGFSTQLALGRSTFAAPPLVHVHAVVFFGWVGFYVLQSALVARGSVALHRRLGWIGAGWAAVIVLLGITTTVAMVRRGTTPFFFQPGYFLFMNCLTVLAFGGLVAAAIRLRRRTEWHRRLLLCAMAILTGPAFGRLLPMPLLIPHGGWGVFACVMLFPLVGALADRRRGRVHPAYWWGMGVIAGTQLLIGAIAASGAGVAAYHAVAARSAGDAIDPLLFPPFP